jgi:hypothetical protein
VRAQLGLNHPEGWFTILGENLGNGLAEVGFDLRVHIDERTVQTFCQKPSDGRLAGAHEAGKDDVLFCRKRSGSHKIRVGVALVK